MFIIMCLRLIDVIITYCIFHVKSFHDIIFSVKDCLSESISRDFIQIPLVCD